MITLPTRVIFLELGGFILSEHRCRRLAHICQTGIRLVNTSHWITTRTAQTQTVSYCPSTGELITRECWPTFGEQLFDAFRHPTRPIIPGPNRDHSIGIKEWLSLHPEVTDYRILDTDDYPWTTEQSIKWINLIPHRGLGTQDLAALQEWAGLLLPDPAAAPTTPFFEAD